jgi:citrate synthase
MSYVPGLAGVIAARTAVSHVDGETGGLWVRGQPIAEVAGRGFEGAAELVLGAPCLGLGQARVRAFERQRETPVSTDAMRGLMALVAAAPAGIEDLIAEVAVATGRMAAALVGRDPLRPDADRDHASDLLRLMLGREPSLAEGRALGAYLATVMDHGLNASTFAARVVASTGADATSAVLAGLGALSGPLHGGAPGPVLDMLDAVGRPERASAWVEAELDAGRRIMGMGHRIYRVRDPRADVLSRALGDLPTERSELARAVELAAERALDARHPGRALRANVEFQTAVLLDAIGVDRRLFTAVFACGRVVGWLAHVAEERWVGRIMRPNAEYVGPPLQ